MEHICSFISQSFFLSFIFTFLQLTHIYVMFAIDVFLTHDTDNRDEHAAVILDFSMFIRCIKQLFLMIFF